MKIIAAALYSGSVIRNTCPPFELIVDSNEESELLCVLMMEQADKIIIVI